MMYDQFIEVYGLQLASELKTDWDSGILKLTISQIKKDIS